MILGGCPGSRNKTKWGHFSKRIFAEGRSTRSLWCLEKIQGPIWRSKDHLVMKGLSKNVKNHDFKETHYSVRQKIGDPGSTSTQNMFPLHSVTPKRPESPYGAKYFVLQKNMFFVFSFLALYKKLLISGERRGSKQPLEAWFMCNKNMQSQLMFLSAL